MRVMVFDVAADSGGALSVLRDFYAACTPVENDEYFFITSGDFLADKDRVKILTYSWVKRNWICRLWFELFIAPRLVITYKIDKIISLQNLVVPRVEVEQSILVHNSIPFSDYKFNFFKDSKLWIYQNIIGILIKKSIIKADSITVQTKWMKKECVKKLGVDGKKIKVAPPEINIVPKEMFEYSNMLLPSFFYPASAVRFKNHKVIVDATEILIKSGIKQFKIICTIIGNENRGIRSLQKVIKDRNLPIEFIGILPREEVFKYYSKSILVFPSFLESSPLPLSEARIHGTPILASDTTFSHELLDDYNYVNYFNPNDAQQLADEMKAYL